MEIFFGLVFVMITMLAFSNVVDMVNDEEYIKALVLTVVWIITFIWGCFLIAD